ncbi:MAG: hypothetical protein A4E32_01170 [Methanomassiliicoccales archaeon PtaU1.Bin124]|nr:MAG: hypothetical protein A4E32_01170 [Methanomassiliicoccales archaeon PtaU1.Bin124]
MSDKETFDQILIEASRMRKAMAEAPGRYIKAKAIMAEAREKVDRNPKRALKLMTSAREEVEQEAAVLRRLANIRRRRTILPSYQAMDEEVVRENQLDELLQNGDYQNAQANLDFLESALHDDVEQSVENEVALELPEAQLTFGQGNTLVLKIANRTKFPMRMLKLAGSSAQAQVIVFDEFKGVVLAGASKDVRVNIIPNIEGDLVIELEGMVEMSSRQIPVKKHSSMKVKPAPVQTIYVQGTPGQMPIAPPKMALSDPLDLIDKGSVDQWCSLITTYYESKAAMSLEGLVQKVSGFQTAEGYRSLFQALLLIDYSNPQAWHDWFSSQGIVGEEMTRRCSELFFHLASAKGAYELELDGNVGSSNNQYLISALHVASGLIALDRERRKDVMKWEITGTRNGKPFLLTVERAIKKGEAGARSRSVFKMALS